MRYLICSTSSIRTLFLVKAVMFKSSYIKSTCSSKANSGFTKSFMACLRLSIIRDQDIRILEAMVTNGWNRRVMDNALPPRTHWSNLVWLTYGTSRIDPTYLILSTSSLLMLFRLSIGSYSGPYDSRRLRSSLFCERKTLQHSNTPTLVTLPLSVDF